MTALALPRRQEQQPPRRSTEAAIFCEIATIEVTTNGIAIFRQPLIRLADRSLRNRLAGSTELCGKILQLRQSVSHRQNRLGIVDVDARAKLERRQRCCKNVDQAQRRMVRH